MPQVFSLFQAPQFVPSGLTPRVVRRYIQAADRAVSSAEEHLLDMEGVAGSIPAPPTSQINHLGTYSAVL